MKISENLSYVFRLMKCGYILSINDNECVYDYLMLKILILFSFLILINILFKNGKMFF